MANIRYVVAHSIHSRLVDRDQRKQDNTTRKKEDENKQDDGRKRCLTPSPRMMDERDRRGLFLYFPQQMPKW